jgi:hypothetical protein
VARNAGTALLRAFPNVLDKLPRRFQSKAKQALHAIMNAPTHAEVEAGIDAFPPRR